VRLERFRHDAACGGDQRRPCGARGHRRWAQRWNLEGRRAAARLIQTAQSRKGQAFIYVNNRFEGNALQTIAAVIEEAG